MAGLKYLCLTELGKPYDTHQHTTMPRFSETRRLLHPPKQYRKLSRPCCPSSGYQAQPLDGITILIIASIFAILILTTVLQLLHVALALRPATSHAIQLITQISATISSLNEISNIKSCGSITANLSVGQVRNGLSWLLNYKMFSRESSSLVLLAAAR